MLIAPWAFLLSHSCSSRRLVRKLSRIPCVLPFLSGKSCWHIPAQLCRPLICARLSISKLPDAQYPPPVSKSAVVVCSNWPPNLIQSASRSLESFEWSMARIFGRLPAKAWTCPSAGEGEVPMCGFLGECRQAFFPQTLLRPILPRFNPASENYRTKLVKLPSSFCIFLVLSCSICK